jgi:O-acetyl-ADP-ribose deacetylase (regulator of RNase III)
MPVKKIIGNIFTSDCQTLVNTVNCVGVMGAGIALECRLRYPEMYERYAVLCSEQKLKIGLLWLFKGDDRWILNFPTKNHWKHPSKEEYLNLGLRKFVESYESKGIESIAFPMLGSDRGGIDAHVSERIMLEHLDPLPIPIEIYEYDPSASDDLFDRFRGWMMNPGSERICLEAGVGKRQLDALAVAVSSPQVRQLGQLIQFQGVGLRTMERVFGIARQGFEAQCGDLFGSQAD